MRPPPLHGVRVLDCTDESAAMAGRILADLGAEVVLVEPPEGSRTRRLAPFLGDVAGIERSCVHQYLNANKRSVVVRGADEFRRLAATADVVLHNGRVELGAKNPGLIDVAVTAFGPTGPRAAWKATDLTAGAAGGLVWLCGERRDPPNHGSANPSYTMASLAAATSVLLALRARDRDPVPCWRGG